jgi:hypothetical protein
VRQKSSSAADARRLSGVTMTPVNWHAQWMVAACQRFCSTVTKWSPGFKPSSSKPRTSAEMR